MNPILQIERICASEKYCNLSKALSGVLLHIVDMDNDADNDMRSGSNLMAWRIHRRMTQEELAERVGTGSGQISLLENGKRQLSVKWLYRLADALEITPGWLLDHKPEDLDSDILEIWGQIPVRQRTIARDVLVAFRHDEQTGTDG